MRAGDSVDLGLRAFPSQAPMQGSGWTRGELEGFASVHKKTQAKCVWWEGPVGFLKLPLPGAQPPLHPRR